MDAVPARPSPGREVRRVIRWLALSAGVMGVGRWSPRYSMRRLGRSW
jgi:hypothetical protein